MKNVKKKGLIFINNNKKITKKKENKTKQVISSLLLAGALVGTIGGTVTPFMTPTKVYAFASENDKKEAKETKISYVDVSTATKQDVEKTT